jgi:four helix bundle protein
MGLQKYEDLIVWQKAMDLVAEVYKIVKLLPDEELYALSDQMRRAVVSIPSNIAEGQERNTTKDFIKFLHIAKGSKAELETQLLICVRLQYLTQFQIETSQSLLVEIGKMLNALIQSLSSKLSYPSPPDF